MQPPPQIGRDIIPDRAYLLGKHFEDKKDLSIVLKERPKNQDYETMVQRGQIHTAVSTPKRDYGLRNSIDDVASLQTNPQVDYRAAMTLDAQRPTYVHQSSQARYQ